MKKRVTFIVLSIIVIAESFASSPKTQKDPANIANEVWSEINNPQKQVSSQKDVVSVIGFGEGKTRENATKQALLSAIEQTFGTFVSAKTEVLNDQLISDEIVTVSRGNVQSYSVIESSVLPNGNTSISVNATISISKLVNYAKGKGMTTELAGATFVMNRNIAKLQLESREKALVHLYHELFTNIPAFVDYTMETGKPRVENGYIKVPVVVSFSKNENYKAYNNKFNKTLNELRYTDAEIEELHNYGFNLCKLEQTQTLMQRAGSLCFNTGLTRFEIRDNIGNVFYMVGYLGCSSGSYKYGSSDNQTTYGSGLGFGSFFREDNKKKFDLGYQPFAPLWKIRDNFVYINCLNMYNIEEFPKSNLTYAIFKNHKLDENLVSNIKFEATENSVVISFYVGYTEMELSKLKSLKIEPSNEHGFLFNKLYFTDYSGYLTVDENFVCKRRLAQMLMINDDNYDEFVIANDNRFYVPQSYKLRTRHGDYNGSIERGVFRISNH